MKSLLTVITSILFSLLFFVSAADACSSFRIRTEDGHGFLVFNFELGGKPNSSIVFYPRGTRFTASAPKGRTPASWQTKYAVVGMDWFDQEMIGGGINEHGLAGANLNLPNYTQYQEVSEEDDGKIIAAWDVPTYFLTHFKNVEEVKVGFSEVKVARQLWNVMGGLQNIEFHYTFHDPSGASIVVEYIDGKVKIYDNELGVMTNSPNFEWQRVNLNNYINLTSIDAKAKKIADVELIATGAGSGMLGLPGDYTPVSRFVRATALTQSALPSKTHAEGLRMAMHISSAMSFPEGPATLIMGDKTYSGKTDWVMLADMSERKMYFRHYDYINWRVIDLENLVGKAKEPLYFDLKTGSGFEDVSAQFAPLGK